MTYPIRQIIAGLLIALFGVNSTFVPVSFAQVPFLPSAGSMVAMTGAYNPLAIKGVHLYPDNPFKFDFIVDTGDSHLSQDELREQGRKLIGYFLASLTTPEKEMWVNLSPYEKDRIIPKTFGETEMGKDLLAQDYLLKQIMATALYPERQLGREFWQKVYSEAKAKFGTTDVPVSTFNKVWILPDQAVVYENSQTNSVFVVKSTLKVMLEQDYLALKNNIHVQQNDVSALGSQVIREIVIPALQQEVNEGRNFAPLRQVYQSLILAAWYKKNLKDNVIAQAYVDRDKIRGVDVEDKNITQKIYTQYLQAYRKGVYNYIKEDVDPVTQDVIPRKYFSGGENFKDMARIMTSTKDPAMLSGLIQRARNFLVLTSGAVIPGVATTGSSSAAQGPVEMDSQALLDLLSGYNDSLNNYLSDAEIMLKKLDDLPQERKSDPDVEREHSIFYVAQSQIRTNLKLISDLQMMVREGKGLQHASRDVEAIGGTVKRIGTSVGPYEQELKEIKTAEMAYTAISNELFPSVEPVPVETPDEIIGPEAVEKLHEVRQAQAAYEAAVQFKREEQARILESKKESPQELAALLQELEAELNEADNNEKNAYEYWQQLWAEFQDILFKEYTQNRTQQVADRFESLLQGDHYAFRVDQWLKAILAEEAVRQQILADYILEQGFSLPPDPLAENFKKDLSDPQVFTDIKNILMTARPGLKDAEIRRNIRLAQGPDSETVFPNVDINAAAALIQEAIIKKIVSAQQSMTDAEYKALKESYGYDDLFVSYVMEIQTFNANALHKIGRLRHFIEIAYANRVVTEDQHQRIEAISKVLTGLTAQIGTAPVENQDQFDAYKSDFNNKIIAATTDLKSLNLHNNQTIKEQEAELERENFISSLNSLDEIRLFIKNSARQMGELREDWKDIEGHDAHRAELNQWMVDMQNKIGTVSQRLIDAREAVAAESSPERTQEALQAQDEFNAVKLDFDTGLKREMDAIINFPLTIPKFLMRDKEASETKKFQFEISRSRLRQLMKWSIMAVSLAITLVTSGDAGVNELKGKDFDVHWSNPTPAPVVKPTPLPEAPPSRPKITTRVEPGLPAPPIVEAVPTPVAPPAPVETPAASASNLTDQVYREYTGNTGSIDDFLKDFINRNPGVKKDIVTAFHLESSESTMKEINYYYTLQLHGLIKFNGADWDRRYIVLKPSDKIKIDRPEDTATPKPSQGNYPIIKKHDSAMASNLWNKGGIDLQQVDISSLGGGVRTAFSNAQQLRMLLNADGLVPVIYKIQPLTVPMMNMLLGLNTNGATAHA